MNFATIGVAAAALFWLETGIAARLGRRRVPGLEDLEPIRDESLPTLTIVAAAKDEAPRVEEAARSLLRQDYPNSAVIVVDDRSSDGTSRRFPKTGSGSATRSRKARGPQTRNGSSSWTGT